MACASSPRRCVALPAAAALRVNGACTPARARLRRSYPAHLFGGGAHAPTTSAAGVNTTQARASGIIQARDGYVYIVAPPRDYRELYADYAAVYV